MYSVHYDFADTQKPKQTRIVKPKNNELTQSQTNNFLLNHKRKAQQMLAYIKPSLTSKKPTSKKSKPNIIQSLDANGQPEKPKERRGRKRKTALPIKIPYNWEIKYDNDSLPTIRYPTNKSLPDHLIDEFQQNIHLILPKTTKKQKKTRSYPLDPNRELSGLEGEYINWLKKFWTPERLNVLVEVLVPSAVDFEGDEDDEDNPRVTLSLIDCFCTKYSRVYKTSYPTDKEEDFMIHLSYKQNSGAFQRPSFDVYCRGPKLLLEYVDNECSIQVKNPNSTEIQWDNKKQVGVRMIGENKMVYIITTVGQLNLFRWAILNRVVQYCEEHALEIKKYMKSIKDNNSKKDGTKKKKKNFQENEQSWFVKRTSVIIDFDFGCNPFDKTEDPPSENEIDPEQSENQENQETQETVHDDDIEDTEAIEAAEGAGGAGATESTVNINFEESRYYTEDEEIKQDDTDNDSQMWGSNITE